jgi:hypothetical protein
MATLMTPSTAVWVVTPEVVDLPEQVEAVAVPQFS